ncbi:TonB-dependent receptor domain-containing protein [Sphingomonas humi]|uniref:TonB-dependent receptor n=1 Tax=Sphingomonas humi TaxID=335630 RepID=A0ABP7S650_9SPHN
MIACAPTQAQAAQPVSTPTGTPSAAEQKIENAQSTAQPVETPAEQEIVVVGTQIRGAEPTGALPVTVVGQDRIDAVGSVSGDDLFRSIPQAGDVQFQEARTTGNLNDARGDNTSINLRSLGTGNTLVLLNGRRMVPTPGTQTENFVPVQTANTNAIPLGATKRVEVLRDGAGAIYGSDAVAGVVNIVLDTRYEGLRLDGRYGFADGTDETTLGFKAGTKLGSDTRVMLFGSYTKRTPLFASERDYTASEDHRARVADTPYAGDTAFDNRSTSSPFGSFTVIPTSTAVRQGTVALTTSGAFHVEPVSNTAAGCSSTVYNGNLCLRSGGITGATSRVLRYDENPDRTIRGGLDRYNLFGTASHDLGNVELFAEAGYYRAVLDGQREQSAPLSSAQISIPASNYYNPFGATTINGVANPNRLPNLVNVPTAGLPLTIVNYRPVDTGPRTFTVTDDSVRLLGGARGDFGNFDWESALSYSWARTDDNTKNAVSNTLFQQALAKSTPDAYNPFNGGSQPSFSLGDATPSDLATIRSFLVDVHRISTTSLVTADAKISNARLFALPGGNVGFAAGVELRRETYRDDRDARLDGSITYTDIVTGRKYGTDILGASPAPDVSANRTIASAFLEFAVPLVSPEMRVPLIRSLDLQLAARDEHYSDFGNVLKPKVAASWDLFEGVRLRGSWSESFRAPNLPQFYSAGTQVANTRTDFAFCRITNLSAPCTGVSTLEVRSGNRNLRPEEASNLSAGIVLQPPPLRDLVITADYWQIKQRGVIGIQGAQNQILYDLLLRRTGSSNPNVVRLAPAAGQTVGQLDYVQDDYFNLQPRTIRGYDLELSYRLRDTPLGTFNIQLAGARLLKLQQQPSDIQAKLIEANAAGLLGPGITIAGANSLLRQNGNPLWRASGNLTWRAGPLRAGVLVNYVSSVVDTGPAPVDGKLFTLPSWTTVSTYGEIVLRKDAFGGETRFRVGARNLFDKDPPVYSSNFGFLGSLHNAIGRFVYIELSKSL